MSLLDTNDLDPRLTHDLLLNLYGISKQAYISFANKPRIYSKGYTSTKSHKRVLIEVWWPGSIYAGTLWRYNGYKLKRNMVYIQFLDPINDGWERPEYVYDDLTLEEFDFMYQALKNDEMELLDNLYIHKPFTVMYSIERS